MPYVYAPKKIHRCDCPDEIKAQNEAGIGAIWECSECGKWHKLSYNQKDGAYWERIEKFELPSDYKKCLT